MGIIIPARKYIYRKLDNLNLYLAITYDARDEIDNIKRIETIVTIILFLK